MQRLLLIPVCLVAYAAHAQNPEAAAPAAEIADAAVPQAPTMQSLLDQPAASFTTAPKESYQEAFFTLGRTYGIEIITEPDVKGTIDVDIPAGRTVRQIIESMTYGDDLFYEVEGNRVVVKRGQLVFFQLHIPSNIRKSNSTTTITLSDSNSMGTLNGVNGQTAIQQSANGATGATTGQQNGGTSSVVITEKNETDFWAGITASLGQYIRAGEKATIDPNTGLIGIDGAGPRRLKFFQKWVDAQNEILTRQVDIHAEILSVETDDQRKLGVDLNLAAVRAGGVRIVGAGTATDIAQIASQTLSPETFGANITAGKMSALITALQEQGEVREVAKPQVRVMNNQMAYLVVGQQQGFFSVSASQSIQTGTGQNPVGTESDVFAKETLTFGTIFSVTPNIPSQNEVILDVKPERSSLEGVDISPDGRTRTPRTNVRKAGTRLMLRNGETVVLAGLTDTTTGTGTRGVPGVSKVPILGRLFRTDASSNKRSELIIIITAKIVPPGKPSVIAQSK